MTEREEREQDEQILGAIIAAATACGREVRPSYGHDRVWGSGGGFGLHRLHGSAPCCAVGAGVLYSSIKFDLRNPNATALFAKAYGVTKAYANGVSHGFESPLQSDVRHDLPDFQRGFAVGKAAFEALCLGASPGNR